MNRLEALEHFHKTYAEDVLNQKLHQAAYLYEQRKDELIFLLFNPFNRSVCKPIPEKWPRQGSDTLLIL